MAIVLDGADPSEHRAAVANTPRAAEISRVMRTLGKRGGKARLKKMSAKRRKEIASLAGKASGRARRRVKKRT